MALCIALREARPQKAIESVGIFTVIVLPARLSHEQRRPAFGVLVMGAVPRPLEQRPEAFNGIRVECLVVRGNIFIGAVVDRPVGHELIGVEVGFVLVSYQRRFFYLDGLLDKAQDCCTFGVVGYFGLYIAFALDGSDNGGFASTAAALIVLVGLTGLAADVGFVRLNDALQQCALIAGHRGPDALLHEPRAFLV